LVQVCDGVGVGGGVMVDVMLAEAVDLLMLFDTECIEE
jgi:hypothetical protein